MRRTYSRAFILMGLLPLIYAQQPPPMPEPSPITNAGGQPAADVPANSPEVVNSPAKRRQYVAPGPVGEMLAPPPPPPPAPAGPTGQCPGGPSLPVECDPKRPWPQCPPQSYCYATNSVDIGPYFCCPVWSTYGAAWRPATPFFDYVPPRPANWGAGAPPPPPPPGFAAPPMPAPLPVAGPYKQKRSVLLDALRDQ